MFDQFLLQLLYQIRHLCHRTSKTLYDAHIKLPSAGVLSLHKEIKEDDVPNNKCIQCKFIVVTFMTVNSSDLYSHKRQKEFIPLSLCTTFHLQIFITKWIRPQNRERGASEVQDLPYLAFCDFHCWHRPWHQYSEAPLIRALYLD